MFCTQCGNQLNANGECERCMGVTSGGNQVRVVISRRSAFVGCAVSYKVFVDGREVAKLGNGQSQEVMLSTGPHSFSFDMWSASSSETITIPDNCSVFYVDTMIEMGAFTNKIIVTSAGTEKFNPNSNSVPIQNNVNDQEGKMTTNAIVALVCGLFGFVIAAFPMGIAAIGLGATALNHIKIFPQDKGKALAIIGIALGIIDILAGFVNIILNV